MTDFQRRSLVVLRDSGSGLSPKEFAFAMWPDSPAWMKSQTCGRGANGSQKGAGMCKCAGSYLHKLSRIGWASYDFKTGRIWKITRVGLLALTETESAPLPEA